MNAVRKSFLLSLLFHAIVGSAAYFAFIQQQHPLSHKIKLPLKHINIVAISYAQSSDKKTPRSQPLASAHQPTPTKPLTSPTKSSTLQPSVSISKPVETLTKPLEHVLAPVVTSKTSTKPAVMKQSQEHIQEAIPASSKQKIDLTNEKIAFFSFLKCNIQEHLHYPPSARRRGIEGNVAVRFMLSNKGDINGISIQQGKNIFHHEAISAIQAVSGINIPKNLIEIMPMEIELTLEFHLNNLRRIHIIKEYP